MLTAMTAHLTAETPMAGMFVFRRPWFIGFLLARGDDIGRVRTRESHESACIGGISLRSPGRSSAPSCFRSCSAAPSRIPVTCGLFFLMFVSRSCRCSSHTIKKAQDLKWVCLGLRVHDPLAESVQRTRSDSLTAWRPLPGQVVSAWCRGLCGGCRADGQPLPCSPDSGSARV